MTSSDPDASTDVSVDGDDLTELRDSLSDLADDAQEAKAMIDELISDSDEGGPEEPDDPRD